MTPPHPISHFGVETVEKIESEFTLLLWNIHKCLSKDLPHDLTRLMDQVDIVLFQEALDSSWWTHFFSHYQFRWDFFRGFRFPRSDISSGVMTGSRYLSTHQDIHTTRDREPILRTRKSSGFSLFPISGREDSLLVINTHAMNFNFGKAFREQIIETMHRIRDHVGPMIWAGDFNTWSRGRKQFLADTARELQLDWLIPEQDTRFLQLDHILYRGLIPIEASVESDFRSSDHKPIIAQFSFL